MKGAESSEKLQKLEGGLYGRFETDEVRYRISKE